MNAHMKIIKRERSHVRDTLAGRQLVADAVDSGPQYPPAEFYLDDTPAEILVGPVGSLYTFTTVYDAKGRHYSLAMVDFDAGVRVFGRLIDQPGVALSIGSVVEVVPSTLDDGSQDYAFKPVGASS